MDSLPKHEGILVQVLQEQGIQDAGSSAASILTRILVQFPVNLNGNAVADPPAPLPLK